MLFSYSLLVFALTSFVTATLSPVLLHNKDPRLTDEAKKYFWFQVRESGATFSWPRNRKYDDFIQFITDPIEDGGDPESPTLTHWVSAVSVLELKRTVVYPNRDAYLYCLHGPHGDPYNIIRSRGSLNDISLGLTGFWRRSKMLPATVSDFRKA
jgi:hypothetical protein